MPAGRTTDTLIKGVLLVNNALLTNHVRKGVVVGIDRLRGHKPSIPTSGLANITEIPATKYVRRQCLTNKGKGVPTTSS
jgi:hypothetical protein